MQVVVVAHEHRVRLDVHLDVQVAGGTAAVADLALVRHADAHAVINAGRDVDHQVAGGAHAAVAGALGARVGDHFAEAMALGALAGGHHIAQERLLHLLDRAVALAHVTGDRLSP